MEKIKCECGAKIQKTSMSAHLKSKKHQHFLKYPNTIQIKEGKVVISFD
jgi:hypothetical protein